MKSSHFSFALAALALGASLSGCVIPPVVMVATYAVDGVSYVATGKGTKDHILSYIMDQDCAMLRRIIRCAVITARLA
jgi:hypothetical protein